MKAADRLRNPPPKTKLKFNLSFEDNPPELIFEYEEKIYRIKLVGDRQREIMRQMFEKTSKDIERWSLYDLAEISDAKENAEKNIRDSIYNLNKKMAAKIPGLGNVFIFDNHAVKLDTEYVSRS